MGVPMAHRSHLKTDLLWIDNFSARPSNIKPICPQRMCEAGRHFGNMEEKRARPFRLRWYPCQCKEIVVAFINRFTTEKVWIAIEAAQVKIAASFKISFRMRSGLVVTDHRGAATALPADFTGKFCFIYICNMV